MNSRPICVECSKNTGKVTRFYPEKNGVIVPYGSGGCVHADLYECPECHRQIVIGFAQSPIGGHEPIAKSFLESQHNILPGIKDS